MNFSMKLIPCDSTKDKESNVTPVNSKYMMTKFSLNWLVDNTHAVMS